MMDDKDQTVLWALQELNDQIERADAAIARAETAEAALAERDKPCVCGVIHHGMILHGNRYCPNCGHPIEVTK